MIGAAIWGTLALASAATVVARRPWTEPLARRRNPVEVHGLPIFRETNLVITAGWTLIFAAAALISAVSPAWVSLALPAPMPALAHLSFKLGPKYAMWRLSRGAHVEEVPYDRQSR